MALSVGIVGLPNVGKSTLFNALLKREIASVSEYPFTTIEPNAGIVELPDERLTALADTLKIKKRVPAVVKFIDIAGLVKGAHKGEGLGNQFLAHIRQTDAILHVVRGFVNQEAPHVSGEIDPVHDLNTVNLELILADFEVAAKALQEMAKNPRSDHKKTAALEKAKSVLAGGDLLNSVDFNLEERLLLKEYNFLTLKPAFYLLNLNETSVAASKGWEDWAEKEKPAALPPLIICSAKLESEIYELSPQEQVEYLRAIGLDKPVLDRIIQQCYQLLGLISFFTVKGGQQAQAWPLKQGSSAVEAAGVVHTDFANRFIKAEVINWQALIKAKTWLAAREQGGLRLVGRDYQINDGEVVEFKFGPDARRD